MKEIPKYKNVIQAIVEDHLSLRVTNEASLFYNQFNIRHHVSE